MVYLNAHICAMLREMGEIYRFKNLVKCSIITIRQWGYDNEEILKVKGEQISEFI